MAKKNKGNIQKTLLLRGDIYKKQGNISAAKEEYQKAVFYNINMKAAQDALASVE